MACEQESSVHYYKISDWCEFLAIKCDKASKLYSVRCNQKLLFTDPEELRRDIWEYFIPMEFCEMKEKEFQVHSGMMEEIVSVFLIKEESLGPRACALLASHVDCVCDCYCITDDCDKNDILSLVKVFTYCHRPLVYDIVWTHIIAACRMHFDTCCTYIFSSFIVLHGFPDKFFSSDDCFAVQNEELQAYSAYIEQICPRLVNEHEGKGCNCKKEVTHESKAPYNVFVKKVADAHLVKLFACQISVECFMQLLDLLLLDGFDFVHKVSIKIVEKMHVNANHAVKKIARGCSHTEENLCVAASVGACCLIKKISDPAFKACMKSVFKDKKLDVPNALNKGNYSCFRSTACFDESLSFHVGVGHVTEKRLAQLIKTRECMDENCIELDEEYTNYYQESIDYEVCCLKKIKELNCDCVLTYDEFVYIFGKRKNGLFCWPIDCIHNLFLAVDFHHKCCISVSELKVILTLVSKLSPDNKLTMICQVNGHCDSKIAGSKAKCIISQLETLVLSGDDHCQPSKEAIDSKIGDKLRDDKTISMIEFIEFSKSISELSALFAVMDCKKEDCSEKLCRTYKNSHSPINQSPNLSFTKELTDDPSSQDQEQETIFEAMDNMKKKAGEMKKPEFKKPELLEERNCQECSIY